MAKYTVCHDHKDEVFEANAKTFQDLLFAHPDILATAQAEEASLFRIMFKRPLVVSSSGRTIKDIYFDSSTFLYEKNELDTLEEVRDSNGNRANFTLLAHCMLNTEHNGWISEDYRNLLKAYFSELNAMEFDVAASTAFERIAAREPTPASDKGTLFGIPRSTLRAAVMDAGWFIMMDTEQPVLVGNKKQLANAIRNAEKGKAVSWGKKNVFHLLAVNTPFNIPAPTGSPARAVEMQSQFYLVGSAAPYLVYDIRVYDRDLQSENDKTELCWCAASVGGQKPFDIASITENTIKTRNGELTLADLFSSACEDPRMPETTRSKIQSSGICSAGRKEAPSAVQEEENCTYLFTSPTINTVVDMLYRPKTITKSAGITMSYDDITNNTITKYKGTTDTLEFTTPDSWDKFLPQSIPSAPKVFDMMVRRVRADLGQEVLQFEYKDFVDAGVYKNAKAAKTGVDHIVSKLYAMDLQSQTMEYVSGKKEMRSIHERVLPKVNYGKRDVMLSFSQVFKTNAVYYSTLPEWTLKLNSASYVLLRTVVDFLRKNPRLVSTTNCFSIKVDYIREKMGLPDPAKERRLNERIREPIEKAWDDFEDAQNVLADKQFLMISPDGEWGEMNTRDWLEHSFVITVSDELAEEIREIHKKARQRSLPSGKGTKPPKNTTP